MKSIFNISRDSYKLNEIDINIFEYKDVYVATNKRTYGWAILDIEEINLLLHPEGLENNAFTQRMFELGLVLKNDQYICLSPVHHSEKLLYLEINITNGCNLSCKYCVSNFCNTKSVTNMDFKTAETLCTKIKNYIRKTKIPKMGIEFSGGEPFLNFEIIKYFIKELNRSCDTEFIFVIQTNGTLISQEHIDFLNNYENVQIAFSLDGITEKHNLNRVCKDESSSFNNIIKGLEIIKKSEVNFNVVTVVNKDNIDDLVEIVTCFIQSNILHFSLLPLLHFSKAKQNKLSIEMSYFVEKLWEVNEKVLKPFYNKNGYPIPLRDIGIAYSYFIQPSRHFMCNRAPCGAGINILSIAPNGDIYPCYGFQGVQEFLISNVNHDIQLDSINKTDVVLNLKDRICDKIKGCDGCNYRIWCFGGCPSNSYLEGGEIMQKDNIKCEINRKFIEKCLDSFIDEEEDMTYVKSIGSLWNGGVCDD